MKAKSYIGTSGYMYDHWKSVFYPGDLAKNNWLEYYSRFFDTTELNVTFYNLPKAESFKRWREMTPPNFQFSIKGPRLITHFKKLHNISENLDLFYDHASNLRDKLGVIIWQFPPAWELNLERFSLFLDMLKKFPLPRYAFEFRNKSWFDSRVYQLLANANAVIVLCDWPFNVVGENQSSVNEIEEKEKIIVPDTANFFYIRRHGSISLYSSLYGEQELIRDKMMISNWINEGNDVYEYFNNDAAGNAIQNAAELKFLLSN